MAIKELLSKVKAMITGDNADAVKAVIDSIETEFDTFEESKRKADSEAKSRKLDLQDRDRTIEKYEKEIENLKKDNPDVNALKEKAASYDKLLAEQTASRLKTWNEKSAIFNLPDTDKRKANMDKLKPKFHFAEKDQTLSDEQITHNLNLYETLEIAGAFGEIKTESKPDPRPRNAGDKPLSSGAALFKKTVT